MLKCEKKREKLLPAATPLPLEQEHRFYKLYVMIMYGHFVRIKELQQWEMHVHVVFQIHNRS